MINLTEEERHKFAAYLKQEAATAQGLIEQAQKLGPIGEVMAKKLRAEALAQRVVAQMFSTTEVQEITGRENPGI